MSTVNVYDKNVELGQKIIFKSNKLYLEFEDANSVEEGEKVTLMKWGNFKITKVIKSENEVSLEAEYMEGDTDYKGTKKFCWLDQNAPLIEVTLVEYDNILSVKKYDAEDPKIKLEDVCQKNTRFETVALAEPHIKSL